MSVKFITDGRTGDESLSLNISTTYKAKLQLLQFIIIWEKCGTFCLIFSWRRGLRIRNGYLICHYQKCKLIPKGRNMAQNHFHQTTNITKSSRISWNHFFGNEL